MDDREIVELYWRRDEAAIAQTQCRYGSFCLAVAMSLLSNGEDAKECVNETLYQAWNLIPPQRPEKLRPWLGRIVRNISVSLWRRNHRQKRYNGVEQALSELEDAVPSLMLVEREVESAELGEAISQWLRSLPNDDRVLFVRRYWYAVPLNELAEECGIAPKKLAQRMYRLRLSLKKFLEKEGIFNAED
nr:sigma-70 family RNA polymerase sigma factor [uncultured Acetatifactor sp.]